MEKVTWKGKTAIVFVKEGKASEDDMIKALKKKDFGGTIVKEKKKEEA